MRTTFIALLLLVSPVAQASALEAVRTRGELLWGADAQDGAPYVFQDPMDPNRVIGFEVDLAEAIARKLGVRARPVQGPWDKLLDTPPRLRSCRHGTSPRGSMVFAGG